MSTAKDVVRLLDMARSCDRCAGYIDEEDQRVGLLKCAAEYRRSALSMIEKLRHEEAQHHRQFMQRARLMVRT